MNWKTLENIIRQYVLNPSSQTPDRVELMAPTADHLRSSSGEELDSGCRYYICMTL